MRNQLSRRQFLFGLSTSATSAVLMACGAAPEVASSTVVPAATTASSAATTAPAMVEATVDTVTASTTTAGQEATHAIAVVYPPFTKLSPTRVFSEPRSVASNQKFIAGDAIEKTAADRLTEEMLGYRFEPKFLFSGGQEYREKLNLALVSNDLPDQFSVYPFDLYKQMVDAGALKDLTAIWSSAASDQVKETLNWGDGLLWQPLTIDGKVYGWPGIKVVGQDEKLLWYRKDWLEKIGAKPPTTFDEMREVAKALIQAKLAGNNQITIGLPLNKELNTWLNSTDPFFGAFGVMPAGESTGFHWRKMPDGSVQSLSIMPETKEALALLNSWYKAGIIAPEFFTVDTAKSAEVITNNQTGMFFGPYWCSGWPLGDADKNAGFDNTKDESPWAFTTIPTGPNGRGTLFTLPVQSAQVFNATMSDDDAVALIKAIGWREALANPSNKFVSKWPGFLGYDYTVEGGRITATSGIEAPVIPPGTRIDVLAEQRENGYRAMLFEKSKSDPNALNAYEQFLVETNFTGPGAALKQRQRDAYKEAVNAASSYAIRSDFNGIPGAVMTSETKNLLELERAAFIDIITGNQPISAFDEYVAQWKARGGDAMTKEVDTALNKQV